LFESHPHKETDMKIKTKVRGGGIREPIRGCA
jgi:hypothetical protein